MFADATSFTRNISSWCVEQIPTKPVGFDEAAEVTGDSTFASAFTIPAGGGAAPTIAGFTVRGLPAVDASGTDGDWTVRNVTVTGDDIIALGAGRNWTVEQTEIMNDGNISAEDSTGDWRVTDTEIAGVGLRAENSTGDWLVDGTSEITGASLAVSATNTEGAWRIHRTNIVNTTDDIDATGADPRGNARRNWWGSFTGEDSADCVGNVSCANPLGEPASANATGFAVTLANELSTPLTGIEVYAYNLPEQDDDTLQLTLNEFDGQETVTDDQIPDGTARETTTGPTGVARPTGFAEELSELRARLSSAIDTRIQTAARGHDRTTDTLYGDDTRGFEEAVPDVILTAAEAKGTIAG
jgi:hypothetical protein